MSLTTALVTGPLGAALLIAAIGYAVLAAEKGRPALDVDVPVPYLPADDLMAIADAVQDEPQDDFDRWLAGAPSSSAGSTLTGDELARRRAERSVQ